MPHLIRSLHFQCLSCMLQTLVSFISSATLLSSGMHLGFSAVSLPHMQDPAGPDRLTVEEGSWFGTYSSANERDDWLVEWTSTKLNWLAERLFHNTYMKRLFNKIHGFCRNSVDEINIKMGARGGAIGWGTALQAERSLVLFPIETLVFFIDIILPAALWLCDRLGL